MNGINGNVEFIGFVFSAATAFIVVLSLGIALYILIKTQTRRTQARDLILKYLKDKNFEMVSFEGIRGYIDQSYDDGFLRSLPKHFPTVLRFAYLKDPETGKNTRSGLAGIVETLRVPRDSKVARAEGSNAATDT